MHLRVARRVHFTAARGLELERALMSRAAACGLAREPARRGERERRKRRRGRRFGRRSSAQVVKLTYATSASHARSAAISRSTSAVVATAKRSTLASRQSTSVLRAAAVRGKMASYLS